MIRLYAKTNPCDPPTRWGRTFATAAKALDRAARLKAAEVEVRDDSKPRSQSLLAIFAGGRRVGY